MKNQTANYSKNASLKVSYSSFLIAGTTPAIKVTFLNNTQTVVSDVEAKIKINGFEMTYNAKQQILSVKEAEHSGWGLMNGVKEVEIAIISYTIINGKKYVVPQNKMQWKHIDL